MARNTEFLQRVHSLWTAWLIIYFMVEIQWDGYTQADIYMSELWHFLVCIGPFPR